MIESRRTKRLKALEFGSKEKFVKQEKLSELRERACNEKEKEKRTWKRKVGKEGKVSELRARLQWKGKSKRKQEKWEKMSELKDINNDQ